MSQRKRKVLGRRIFRDKGVDRKKKKKRSTMVLIFLAEGHRSTAISLVTPFSGNVPFYCICPFPLTLRMTCRAVAEKRDIISSKDKLITLDTRSIGEDDGYCCNERFVAPRKILSPSCRTYVILWKWSRSPQLCRSNETAYLFINSLQSTH